MIASVLSLATNGFGLGFGVWVKSAVSIMALEFLLEIVLIQIIESRTSKTKREFEAGQC